MTCWADFAEDNFRKEIVREATGHTKFGEQTSSLVQSTPEEIRKAEKFAEDFLATRRKDAQWVWKEIHNLFSTAPWVFSWPGVGTSPESFTSAKWWTHPKNNCEMTNKEMPFAGFMLGCPFCGAPSHHMVKVSSR